MGSLFKDENTVVLVIVRMRSSITIAYKLLSRHLHTKAMIVMINFFNRD